MLSPGTREAVWFGGHSYQPTSTRNVRRQRWSSGAPGMTTIWWSSLRSANPTKNYPCRPSLWSGSPLFWLEDGSASGADHLFEIRPHDHLSHFVQVVFRQARTFCRSIFFREGIPRCSHAGAVVTNSSFPQSLRHPRQNGQDFGICARRKGRSSNLSGCRQTLGDLHLC